MNDAEKVAKAKEILTKHFRKGEYARGDTINELCTLFSIEPRPLLAAQFNELKERILKS